MPLKFKKEPGEVKEVVEKQLLKMASGRAFRTSGLAKTQVSEKVSELASDQVIPVYHLGLDDLKQKKDITSATQRSWRYLVKHEDKVIATADAVEQNGKTVFSHVNEGPLVSGVVAALNKAENLDELQSGDFEVRLLMVPALYVAALWFVDQVGGQDRVMPIEPTSSPLRANELISISDLMDVLWELAEAYPE